MIKTRGYRLLVKPDPIVTKTETGIELPVDEKLEKTGVQYGIVVDVGDISWEAYRQVDDNGVQKSGKPWAQIGDYVLYARHAGRVVFDPMDMEEYVVMNDDDIIATIHEGSNVIPDNAIQKEAIAKKRYV